MRRWVCLLLLGAALGASLAADTGNVLLEERFDNNARHWREDNFSRLDSGGYLIEARQQGGYYRWLDEPSNLRDFVLQVECEKRRGDNVGPLFGVIFRVQDSWRNSYFFVLNGAGGYFFGKFRAGKPTVLKQGTDTAIQRAARRNKLVVRASGNLFGLTVNDTPLANVVDDSFPGAGRVGLCAEAPATVWFDNLLVTAVVGGDTGPGPAPPPAGPKVLFADDFQTGTGWPEDAFRYLADGAYHLRNQGEAKSFRSWQRKTDELTNFVANVDVKWQDGSAKALYGVIWHVRDGNSFYFLLISPDSRFFAGVMLDDQSTVVRSARLMVIRGKGEANTLTVRSEQNRFACAVNGTEVCTFSDATLPKGAIGFYLEQPGHVSFANLKVTDLQENAPPVVGGGAARGPWPTGRLVMQDRLDSPATYAWPVDADHLFDQGGYCVKAPKEGSRTVVQQSTVQRTEGVYQVTARPVAGNVSSAYGLAVLADARASSFYYLLLNSAGRYFVGRYRQTRFETLDSGPVSRLRGGDTGNDLQLTVRGDQLRYGINDQPLGQVHLDSAPLGGVGLHVENGLVACFRDLKVAELPQE